MNIIDKTAPSELDRFWTGVGEQLVMATLNGRSSDDFIFAAKSAIVEALKVPGSTEAGHEAYAIGIARTIERVLTDEKYRPALRGMIKRAVLANMPAAIDVKLDLRGATRKTIEHDAAGRVRSVIEEQL